MGWRGLIGLFLVVALIAAGCGDDVESPSSQDATSAADAVAPATDGTLFRDPSGVYTMRVANDWTDGALQSPKSWFTGSASDGFSTNVNVIVETLPAGVDLDRYIEASIQNAPKLIQDFSIISNETVELPSGQPGARLRFSGTGQGRTIMFMQIVALDEDNAAAIATLTAVPDLIDDEIVAAEPYMRTLEVVGSP